MTDKEIYTPQHPCYPSDLRYVVDAINKSTSLLEKEVDWDDDGAPDYKKETWLRAADFISGSALIAYDELDVILNEPDIWPGPAGSIDIRWEYEDKRILLNIPVDENEPIRFFASDRTNKHWVKGNIVGYHAAWIFFWLTE